MPPATVTRFEAASAVNPKTPKALRVVAAATSPRPRPPKKKKVAAPMKQLPWTNSSDTQGDGYRTKTSGWESTVGVVLDRWEWLPIRASSRYTPVSGNVLTSKDEPAEERSHGPCSLAVHQEFQALSMP